MGRVQRHLPALYWPSIAAMLVPVVWFSYLPLSDSASHIYIAKTLVDWYVRHDALVRQYFVPNPTIPPNWTGHLILAATMLLFSANVAEKVVVITYAMLFFSALRYAVSFSGRSNTYLSFFAFPLVYNLQFHWGFLNFCFSLAFYLFFLGAYLRYESSPGFLGRVSLFVLAILSYLSSPIGFLELIITAGFLWLHKWITERGGLAGLRKAVVDFTLIFGPSVALYAYFLKNKLPIGPDRADWPTPRYAAATLFTLAPLASFRPSERAAGFIVAVLLAAATSLALWNGLRSRAGLAGTRFLYLAGILGGVVFLSPSSWGGGTMITPRLVYFPVFAVVMFLASQPPPPSLRVMAPAVSLAVAGYLLAVHVPLYARYDRAVTEALSLVRAIPPGHTFALRSFQSPFTVPLSPGSDTPSIGSVGEYLCVDRDLIDLNDYEARTNHFPLIYRALITGNPSTEQAACGDVFPWQGTPDYVMGWGLHAPQLDHMGDELSHCGYVRANLAKQHPNFALFRRLQSTPNPANSN